MVVKTVLGSHFGVGEFATHFRTYFSDWIESDVHWGYGILTHGHFGVMRELLKVAQRVHSSPFLEMASGARRFRREQNSLQMLWVLAHPVARELSEVCIGMALALSTSFLIEVGSDVLFFLFLGLVFLTRAGLVGCFTWLVGWLAGWLVGWLVGWSVIPKATLRAVLSQQHPTQISSKPIPNPPKVNPNPAQPQSGCQP